jgi:co-chaperonin GroES (HSP10)
MHLIEPLGGYFLVRYVSGKKLDKKSESGLILVTKQETKNRVMQVLACGPGMYNPFSGGRFEHGINPGDLLYVNQHGPAIVEHIEAVGKQEETFLLGETDIFGVYARYKDALDKGLCEALPE